MVDEFVCHFTIHVMIPWYHRHDDDIRMVAEMVVSDADNKWKDGCLEESKSRSWSALGVADRRVDSSSFVVESNWSSEEDRPFGKGNRFQRGAFLCRKVLRILWRSLILERRTYGRGFMLESRRKLSRPAGTLPSTWLMWQRRPISHATTLPTIKTISACPRLVVPCYLSMNSRRRLITKLAWPIHMKYFINAGKTIYQVKVTANTSYNVPP